MLAALTVAIRAPLMPLPGYVSDQTQFMLWADMSQNGGLASVYEFSSVPQRRWSNYPPAYLYVLRVLAPLTTLASGEQFDGETVFAVYDMQDTSETRVASAVFKTPAVLADAALVLLLVVFLTPRIGKSPALAIGAIYGLMPAAIHNSAMWGQVDAIHTLLMIVSLEMLLRRRYCWMTFFAVLGILTKAQSIMLAPLWFVPTLQWARADWRRWGKVILVALGVTLPILLPFIPAAMGGVWESYRDAASYYPYVHLNGFSAWFLTNPMAEPHLDSSMAQWYHGDNVPLFLNITARQVGMLAFVVLSTIIMVRLAMRRCAADVLRWAARTLPLAFFVLSTQMHERYLFPAIAIWAWAAAENRRWWGAWIVLGLCVAVNNFWAWSGPQDAWWSNAVSQALHRNGIGVACGIVTILLLVLSLSGWLEPRKKTASLSSPPASNTLME